MEYRHYPECHEKEQDMHAQVRDLLVQGLIWRSDREYSNPVVTVCQINGNYRMCFDFRKINTVAKTSAHPLPFVYLKLHKLWNVRYIYTIDMSKSYYYIQMHKDSVK